jgi:cystathionine beta-lyase family protein involved in aluminum resistance
VELAASELLDLMTLAAAVGNKFGRILTLVDSQPGLGFAHCPGWSRSRTIRREFGSPQYLSAPICKLSNHEASRLVLESVESLSASFTKVDCATRANLERVLNAFHVERVGPQHFAGVDGYGHGDLGRETLDAVYARLFGCEGAAVRIQFMSGTHAIACVLYGVLRPGDHVLSAAGPVYDTLEEVLGTRSSMADPGSLKDWGVEFDAVPLDSSSHVDLGRIARTVEEKKSRLVFIQRSFGYAWRPALTNADIAAIVSRVKAVRPQCICFVDNCYGEFIEEFEPVHPSIGADIMAGSLIKNLGGGIVPSGAYVAGRSDIVKQALARLAAPGVGGGATLGMNRSMFQGLFLASQMVGEASKGAMLVGHVMRALGYTTNPGHGEGRGFVQAVRLGTPDRVLQFCRVVQRYGPVGSYIEPTQGVTPGYGDPVVFAQGTFVDGSTLELSADGPIRPPFVVFAQGGTHWTHWQLVLEQIVQRIGYADDIPDSGLNDTASALGAVWEKQSLRGV